MSICSYQTSSPTRDKFAGPSFTDQLPSCALLSFCSPVVYPRAGAPSTPLFFPLNSRDTWPSSLPRDFLRGVSGSRVAIGRYFTRSFAPSYRIASRRVESSRRSMEHRGCFSPPSRPSSTLVLRKTRITHRTATSGTKEF